MTSVGPFRALLNAIVEKAKLEILIAAGVSIDPGLMKSELTKHLPLIIQRYRFLCSAAAAQWYDNQRESEGIGGTFQSIIEDTISDLGIDKLIGYGIGPAYKGRPDDALKLISAGAQRRVLDGARNTLIGSAVADPHASGWQREANAGACYFCHLLASRGAVYSESTVDFGAHDDCECGVAIAWKGMQKPVQEYKVSAKGTSDSRNALAVEWIDGHLR